MEFQKRKKHKGQVAQFAKGMQVQLSYVYERMPSGISMCKTIDGLTQLPKFLKTLLTERGPILLLEQ